MRHQTHTFRFWHFICFITHIWQNFPYDLFYFLFLQNMAEETSFPQYDIHLGTMGCIPCMAEAHRDTAHNMLFLSPYIKPTQYLHMIILASRTTSDLRTCLAYGNNNLDIISALSSTNSQKMKLFALAHTWEILQMLSPAEILHQINSVVIPFLKIPSAV